MTGITWLMVAIMKNYVALVIGECQQLMKNHAQSWTKGRNRIQVSIAIIFPNTSSLRSVLVRLPRLLICLIIDNNSAWRPLLHQLAITIRLSSIATENIGVRLVRSSQSVSLGPSATAPAGSGQTIKAYVDNEWQDSRYTLHNDGTVTDKATKLMWKVCSEGQNWSDTNGSVSCSSTTTTTYSWKGALEHVNSYTFAGHSDWRVPNIKELNSLVALDRYKPSINLSIFPTHQQSGFGLPHLL